VLRLRQDDERALGAIIDAYYDDIAGLAFHYVRSHDAASDIAQETFIGCWNRRHALRTDVILIHYLRRSARNKALDTLRGDARAAKWEGLATDESLAAAPHADNAGIAATETEQFNAIVDRVAATLSPRVREVLLLYYRRGLEPNEIAEALDVAPSTIYNQLRKAMKVFAESLTNWRD
jgi:RNA polymerase sigma-70 factor (ECF subfamily)